jgi:hypothetical protein
MTHTNSTPANPAQVTDAAIDKAVVEAINALRMEHAGRAYDILHDALTAAIGAGGQAAVMAVKPLEFREAEHIEDHAAWYAPSIIGEFVVGFDDGWYATLDDWKWEWETEDDPRTYEGPDAGQEACQKYYESRILSALSQSHPADERVVEAVVDKVLDAAGLYMGEQYGNTALHHPTDRARIKAALSAKEGRS